ncbi:MAG: glycosyltransferase, partial [Bdellovibrionota bacterium]
MKTNRWAKPIHDLRKELGLPASLNPIMRGQYSPFGTWALFSPTFQNRKQDWPVLTSQLGFPFYREPDSALSAACEEFLARHEKPIVFTLGTAAVR